MKNLRKFFTLSALVGMTFACNQAPEADVQASEAQDVETTEPTEATVAYTVNTEGDEIHWVGFKTYSETVHNGEIQVSEGNFTVENGEITGGSFTIDMMSITNNDLPEEGDYNQARLIGHLQSEDFFHAEMYPTATFTVTDVAVAPADNEKGATHMISGNLEMRGNTKNITIPAMVEMTEDAISLKTPEFVIDRTQWEVQALSTSIEGLAKENLVDNNIKLEINLTANRS